MLKYIYKNLFINKKRCQCYTPFLFISLSTKFITSSQFNCCFTLFLNLQSNNIFFSDFKYLLSLKHYLTKFLEIVEC